MSDLYQTLGVPRAASAKDIQRAYRKQAGRAHPDKGGSREAWEALTLARDVLTNAERRERYDCTGEVETNKVDNSEANAMGMIAAALNEAMARCEKSNVDPVQIDLVAECRAILAQKITETEILSGKQRFAAQRAEHLAERFMMKKADNNEHNRMRDLLRSNAANLRRAADANAAILTAIRRAHEIMANYSFMNDPRMNVVIPMMTFVAIR